MASRRNLTMLALSAVLFVLVIAVLFSFISASPAVAAENENDSRILQLEAQVAQLQSVNAELSQTVSQQASLLEQYQQEMNTQYILVLRHEDSVLSGILGEGVTVKSRVQEITVSKLMYDSCQVGDDITTTALHRLLAGGFSQTRVIVEGKYAQ